VQALAVFSPEYVEDRTQDEMKIGLRDEDKQWFSEEIGRQIKAAISATIDSLKPHGWRRVLHIAQQLAPLGLTITLVISIVIGLGAWVIALSGQARTREADETKKAVEEAKFEQKTSDRLDSIEQSLRELRASQVPAKVLTEISKLDTPRLAKSLPALQTISEQPIGRVKPSPTILKDVVYKLRNVDQSADDYWPALLKFLQFASAGLSPEVSTPRHRFNISQLTASGDIVDSTITLSDGVRLKDVRFINCRVIFTANPVEMENVQFINSVFEFPTSVPPSQYIKKAAHLLLTADNLESVSFDLSATHS
jgi:hypothetical protein